MKEQLGNIWTETDARGVLRIGFSREYIDSKLGECFHVIQADTKVARKGCPLMVLETNDGTERVRSPINGTILVFSDKARNFPDRLSEEDVVLEVLPEGVKIPAYAMPKKSLEDWPSLTTFQTLGNTSIDWDRMADQQRLEVQSIEQRLAEARLSNRVRRGTR